MMGDMGDIFNAMREGRKQKHADWRDENRDIIYRIYPRRFTENETAILFREIGKPKVDFYPHTGRWKVGTRMFSGGAYSFCGWYEKQ